MNLEVTETEVRLIKKLLKKELTHVKTEIKLVKIFDLQNKLNNLTIPVVVVPKGTLCRNCESDDTYTCFLTNVVVCNKCQCQY